MVDGFQLARWTGQPHTRSAFTRLTRPLLAIEMALALVYLFGSVASAQSPPLTAPRNVRLVGGAGAPTKLILTPPSAMMSAGGTQQFSAAGKWSDGSTTPLAVTWSASGGPITNAGLYTAGQTAGLFQVTAAHSSGISGVASVTITAPPPPGSACAVAGGSSGAPTALGSVISNQTQCTEFVLGDGVYAATTILRAGITIRALNRCQAQVNPELSIRGRNVTVDGVSVTAAGTAVRVYASGARVQNNCIQGFGKTQYGVGIWVMPEALDPDNLIRITDNKLDDWGGALYSGGIGIGNAADDPSVPARVSVEVVGNRITGGPTNLGAYNSAIQSFHPFVATHNYVHTVTSTSISTKTFGSRIACNEFVNIIGDGALYNRTNSHNVWEYNLIHDSDVGIDHFMGDSNVFRGNVIYNVDLFGRIKDQGMGSTNLLFENNTFHGSTAWAAFIWDATSGGPLSNILWRRNIFHTANGAAINAPPELNAAWDETDNIFYQTSPPSGTTGAGGTSRTINPLINPPSNFAPQEPTAGGIGAPWPLPCSGS
jgi:hypothetical protein